MRPIHQIRQIHPIRQIVLCLSFCILHFAFYIPAAEAASVTFHFQDNTATPISGAKLTVTPVSGPYLATGGGSLTAANLTQFTTDATGSVTVPSLQYGLYQCRLQGGPPVDTTFKILVPSDTGTYTAQSLLTNQTVLTSVPLVLYVTNVFTNAGLTQVTAATNGAQLAITLTVNTNGGSGGGLPGDGTTIITNGGQLAVASYFPALSGSATNPTLTNTTDLSRIHTETNAFGVLRNFNASGAASDDFRFTFGGATSYDLLIAAGNFTLVDAILGQTIFEAPSGGNDFLIADYGLQTPVITNNAAGPGSLQITSGGINSTGTNSFTNSTPGLILSSTQTDGREAMIRQKLLGLTNLITIGDSTTYGYLLPATNINWPYLVASNNSWTLTNYAGIGNDLLDQSQYCWRAAYSNNGVIAYDVGINDYRLDATSGNSNAFKLSWLGNVLLMELGTNKIAATNGLMTLTGSWATPSSPGIPTASKYTQTPGDTASAKVFGRNVVIGVSPYSLSAATFTVTIDGAIMGTNQAIYLQSDGGQAMSYEAFVYTNLYLGLHTVTVTATSAAILIVEYIASVEPSLAQAPVILATTIPPPTNYGTGGDVTLFNNYNAGILGDSRLLVSLGFPVVLCDFASALASFTNSGYVDGLHPGAAANVAEANLILSIANERPPTNFTAAGNGITLTQSGPTNIPTLASFVTNAANLTGTATYAILPTGVITNNEVGTNQLDRVGMTNATITTLTAGTINTNGFPALLANMMFHEASTPTVSVVTNSTSPITTGGTVTILPGSTDLHGIIYITNGTATGGTGAGQAIFTITWGKAFTSTNYCYQIKPLGITGASPMSSAAALTGAGFGYSNTTASASLMTFAGGTAPALAANGFYPIVYSVIGQ